MATEVDPRQPYDFFVHLQELLRGIAAYYPHLTDADKEDIEKAYWFGFDAHKYQYRKSGEPYFSHPVEATKILLAIKPDIETIVASLLHDVIEDTPITALQIEEEFGASVRFLCEGVEKVSKVRTPKAKTQQGDMTTKYKTYRKLFVAVAEDTRVIFVKLADRIHNLSTLHHVPEHKRERIARESMEIYAPVALQLGLFDFKSQIEDMSFRFLYPTEYDELIAHMSGQQKFYENFIEKSRRDILTLCHKAGLTNVQVYGRVKSLWSIHQKMRKKNMSHVHDLYDILALRILVDAPEDCYVALGVLHQKWRPVPKRFKDYISAPKPNGYQSLHTTLLGVAGSTIPTEVQIRTENMHLDAEYGPAAHWAYKQSKTGTFDATYAEKTSWLQEHVTATKTESAADNPEGFYGKLRESVLSDRVYVFTPTGDIKTLPAHSTPVDFAYRVHTQVGDNCIGAKVNGSIKPLDYELQNQDIVEILTREGRTPNPEWLKFVKSSHARSRIGTFVRKQNEELLVGDTPPTKPLKESKDTVVEPKPAKPAPKKPQKPVESRDAKPAIMIGGMPDIPYSFAKCCNPRMGQHIVAYKGRGPQYTIHEPSCTELQQLAPERYMEAYFYTRKKLVVESTLQKQMLRHYTTVVHSTGADIIGYDHKSYRKGDEQRLRCTLVLEVHTDAELEEIRDRLSRVNGVLSVNRG